MDVSVRKITSIKVSVIMPVYNAGKYLTRSVQGALNQTLKEIEVICIDDGSQDESWDILKKIALHDNRLIVVRNPRNLGAARTRNIGLQLAYGEYVTFWDADDWVESKCLEEAFELAKSKEADVCLYGCWRENEATGNKSDYFKLPYYICRRLRGVFNIQTLGGYVYSCGIPFDKICRRQFLLDNGIMFQDLYNSNDNFFSFSVFAIAERMVYIGKNFVHHRVHLVGGCTGTRDKYPKCFVEAANLVRMWMLRSENWNTIRRYYHEYVINNLIYTLSIITEPSQMELLEFMIEKGLTMLHMDSLDRGDFLTRVVYYRYELLLKKRSVKDFLTGTINVYSQYAEEIANKFKQQGKRVAVWGYGKLGKMIVKACISKGCVLLSVYDSDSIKHGQKGDVLVRGYSRNAPFVDVIIIPNDKYIIEISNIICHEGREELLFDVNAWISGIFQWDLCFFRSNEIVIADEL